MRQVARERLINCLVTAVLTAALLVSMIPVSLIQANAASGESDKEKLSLAILSDIHYVSDANRAATGQAKEDFDKAERAENRMMSEIDLILSQALKEAGRTNPDALLVCGDLCSNGELNNENALATKLVTAEQQYGTDIYVVNGNHDINMSYGADFTDSNGVKSTARTQASDFKTVYRNLGYDSNVRYYDADTTTGTSVKNYGGLSYATEIKDGVTLITLDTAQYSGDANAEYNNAQRTAGAVSDGLLAWAKKEAQDAKKKGNLVLAMCHHSLIPHHGIDNNASHMFFSEYLVPDWEKIAGGLADAGVSAVFTGHSHANDISQYMTKAGNTIYDIQTAALCAYPCAWRTLNITIDKSGAQPSYSFDVDTHFMEQAEGLDLIYNDKTYSNLQEYSFVKTGMPEEALPDMAEFLIREQLFAIKNHKDGFNGFLQENIGVPEGMTTGEYGTQEIAKLIDGMEPINEKFTLLDTEYTLKMTLNKDKSEPLKKVLDASLIYWTARDVDKVEIDLANLTEDDIEKLKKKIEEIEEAVKDGDQDPISVDKESKPGHWIIERKERDKDKFPEATWAQLLKLAGEDLNLKQTEEGTLTIDLSGLARGIDIAIGKADTAIKGEESDWDNNYQRTKIEQEGSQLIREEVMPVFTTPIEEGDEETTPQFIARDALQAFARGDEDSSAQQELYEGIYEGKDFSDLKAKREHWNDLINGEQFDKNLKDTVIRAAIGLLDKDKYRKINEILSTYMGPDDEYEPTEDDPKWDGSEGDIDREFYKDKAPIFTFTAKEGSEESTINLLGQMLSQIKSPRLILAIANLLEGLGVNPLQGVDFGELTKLFSELQISLTTDNNIKDDSKWAFHSVNYDAQGGTASALSTLTIDDNKLGALPTATRTGYNFLGWFTQKTGGTKVTENTDFTNINTLYAHWQDRKNQKASDGTAYGKGAAIEAAEAAIAKMASDKDPKGTRIAPLFLKSTKQTKSSVKITWKKAAGANEYVIFGNICGAKNKMKKLATVTGASKTFKKVLGKKVKKGTYYKFMVIAVDKNNDVVSTSKIVHAATKGGKVGNHKRVTVKKAVITKAKKLKKGRTLKLKPTLVLQSKKLKCKKHVAVRYESSNTKVATVSAKGVIKGVEKGSCKVYIYAQDGVSKEVTVKVK